MYPILSSSDFSIAKVTFINADTNTLPYHAQIFHITDDAYISIEAITVIYPVTVDVPLYKGRAEIKLVMLADTDESYMPTTTGGVSLEIPKFVITGDGTITAKGMQPS